jgi:hypothetical protein
MQKYDELDADQILEKILVDEIVDADEVRALEHKLERDWVISPGEMELLFRINKSIGASAEKCPEWTAFFSDNITRLLIMDMGTPGEIDEAEGDWLADTLERYQCGNITETTFLAALKKNAAKISGRITVRLNS